jgi:hypothetical protein
MNYNTLTAVLVRRLNGQIGNIFPKQGKYFPLLLIQTLKILKEKEIYYLGCLSSKIRK